MNNTTNTSSNSNYQYQVGGSLPVNAPSYVMRQADIDLYEGVKASNFCYVLNSRQMGKSSLRVRIMQKLIEEKVACATIDLTAIGSQEVPQNQWYAGIVYTLASNLNLLDKINIKSWWRERDFLTPVQRLGEFIEQVVLKNFGRQIVVFIDEIDSVLGLNFPTDDFFAFIRSCYNLRAEKPEFERITFVLLGVATPSDLIQDKNRTPFNIGKAIELCGFQLHEVWPLAQGLTMKVSNPLLVLKEILDWTGGQPFLTQKLCKLLLSSEDKANNISEAEWVEKIVRSQIIENWELQDEPEHLKTIRDRILKNKQNTGKLLKLYQQVLHQEKEISTETIEAMQLRLFGLIVKHQGKLSVYNRIYASVFNLIWVEQLLASLRPYAESLAGWLDSNCKDESYLLCGQALQEALVWASDSLGNQDYQFLMASQEFEKRELQRALEAALESMQKGLEGKRVAQENSDLDTAIAASGSSFSAFLAPLKKESFRQIIADVENKIKVVCQTLFMLINSEGYDRLLSEMLNAITLKTGELLRADRTTIFLLDEEKNELWSMIGTSDGNAIEIRLPADRGIAGEVATFKKAINIPYDFYDDPRSSFAQISDRKNQYRTYSLLAIPLLKDDGNLVAVVQLMNKLKYPDSHNNSLSERIDLLGFTSEDEEVFADFAPSIRLILEASQSFYIATQKQQAADALIKATQALSQSSLDLEETLQRVMDEAKKLMNADRSTIWLLDRESNELWTKIPIGGEFKKIRIPSTAGFAGKVVESGEPLMIPFDIYDSPLAETNKQTDQRTGYRTCSLLCMPVFNIDGDLIGVAQLINKLRPGNFPPYNPENWPEAPDCFKASFTRTDLEFMKVFNIQAGVALQNANLFATVKQQQQSQRDILRSLNNGIISIDKVGYIKAINESAKRLLGLDDQENFEGKSIFDLIQIQNGDFNKWFNTALSPTKEKEREQYYPDRILLSANEEQHSINLSLSLITDASDPNKIYGVLVVLEDISDEKRLKNLMSRYMSQELAESLLEGEDLKLGGDRKEVSVLFSDIRSYSSFTESMEAEDVLFMLNEYFETMVEAIYKYKGTLDKYIGDSLMAVFGAPMSLEDHAWMAVQTAVEMRHRLQEFNAPRSEFGKQIIKVGIGINSGEVISGNIGSSKRMEFTVIGDGVNLASRIEGLSKQYNCDILLSESTYRYCADRIWFRELDYIRMKGKTLPTGIYELVGLRSEPISSQKEKLIEIYHKGREYYLQKKFRQAMNEFSIILEDLNIPDRASSLYIQRCQHWIENPELVESQWNDGVWNLTEK